MGKIILLDVDGTLINYDGYLPKSVTSAVHQAQKNGHMVFLVTGRSRSHVEKEITDIGFDGMIGGNGAYIEVRDKVIKERVIDDEDVKRIVDYLESHHLEFFIESHDGLYGSKNYEVRGVEALRQYGIKNPVIREVYPDMIFPTSLYQSKVTKINYILESYNDYLQFKENFPEFQNLTWGGQGETAIFGDVALKDIDKSQAIGELLDYLSASQDDTIAFGDAEVDIPMFQYCALSVCMGGGRQAAKEVATYITDTVENDGLYKAFQHFQLIE